MSAVLKFLDEIVTQCTSVFPSPCKLAILNGETLRVLAHSIIDEAFNSETAILKAGPNYHRLGCPNLK
jgi:hypothetical protein